ncbi:MAG: copper chaperone PCu(A)C [Alphaproteobacteria bacterium]|nr:copper chaperone PCu(A)C [Alphaproteobacteria bacterium]
MKNFLTAGVFALAFAVAAPAAAIAAEYKVGDITIVNPWARATPGAARNGGAYLTIRGGASDDKLTGVEADIAMRTEIHGNKQENGVMKMYKVESIEVPAGGMAMLKPGGFHVMLMKLKRALKEGESFPMTLSFAKAGEVTVAFKILGVGAMKGGKGANHDSHGSHGKMKMK